MEKSTKMILQLLNLIGFIATVIINMLAVLLPIGLGTTQELSDAIPNLFVPAGLTFSIWSVIYVLLGAFAIYQMRDMFKSNKIEMPYLEKIGYLFIVGSIVNIVWIFLWGYKLVPLSLIAMILLLGSLLMIYLKLGIGRTKVSRDEKLAVHVPFSVYLGWITVATIANVIAVAVIITFGMLLIRKDVAYSLVVAWASLGIFLKQIVLNSTIATTALIALILVLIGIIFVAIKWMRK
jgi:hypothetical protein